MDEDDPNILLAIQLSLQESGLAIDEETRDFLNNEASLGAIGTSLPTRLDSAPISIDNPRGALSSSELLELGDSLMRLGAGNDPFSADRLHSHPCSDTRSRLYSTSSDADSSSQDPNTNENLLGNIMAWFHDMNPQSIALIPSTSTETDEDSQQPVLKMGQQGNQILQTQGWRLRRSMHYLRMHSKTKAEEPKQRKALLKKTFFQVKRYHKVVIIAGR